MEVRKVGVIGAGQMGSGIAQTCAQSGFAVAVYDKDPAARDAALERVREGLARWADKTGADAAHLKQANACLTPAEHLNAFADADLVVECVVEDEAVKVALFNSLRDVLKPEALLASNTSSLSITRLAAGTDRPERFIGLHFMNPAPLMGLVELIRGIQTSEETFAAARDFVAALGKQSATSEDFPAFIVNRILMPMINEACYTLYEGVGTVRAIDTSMKLGANHPMGPLELADFIGLDTCLAIMRVLNEEFADTKYRPCPLLTKYVEAGWLGRKTGRGFYDYRGETPEPTR